MSLLKKLLGGRPMRRESLAFVDRCSGASVSYYVDTLGRRWLAENRWALFRVPDEAHHGITQRAQEGV